MNFELNARVGARFKLIAHKGDGIPVRETEWFHNLVLDTGLNRMSVDTWINRCLVGTGNSIPTTAQTALDAYTASTTSVIGENAGNQTTSAPYYWWARRQWRFGQGIAKGNISEVGLGWSNADCWNRALIRDANGNPTTITVLADEFLDVVSEVRMYPAQSIGGNFNLLDKSYNIISTHSFTGMPYMASIGAAFSASKVTISRSGGTISAVFSGGIGEGVTGYPLNAQNDSFGGFDNIYPTPRSARYIATFPLNNNNGVIRSFVIAVGGIMKSSGQSGYKLEISPPITKLNTQIMSFTFEMSWGRYEPT